ncbi:DNA polymerase IV [Helcobacillus massiliensis]|uniref:DNA polymerase IV n=1 Tax=Helcobacillus massiliensis TaxID=521392 RepID=A0A839QWS4_9MICO|nr:DNA polymerase-4 [Helcobacillus massiliensis]
MQWDPSERAVLHLDMDAFFASVEMRDDPELRGRAIAVGGGGRRGVIATANYEARRFGVHSAQPTAQALQRCPHLLVLPPRGDVYREVSRQVMAILEDFSPSIEVVSVDEAYIDVTGSQRLLGTPEEIAVEIRRRVQERVGLPCSVGGGISKSVAKICSAKAKPAGILVVEPARTREFLAPLPISVIHGVGPVAAKKLTDMGVTTVGELAELPPQTARRLLGSGAPALQELARGIDRRTLGEQAKDHSIGMERTFENDIGDPDLLRSLTVQMADTVAHRVRTRGFAAASLSVKMRAPDGRTITRTSSFRSPTASSEEIRERALIALERAREQIRWVRLLGVRAEHLVPAGGIAIQDSLDGASASWGKVDAAMDAARAKFGRAALSRGSALRADTDSTSVQRTQRTDPDH